jgi:hypothetical protein
MLARLKRAGLSDLPVTVGIGLVTRSEVVAMFPDGVLVSPDTRDMLGPGMAELEASLWPVDCQTCGRPLGAQPPALAVDDVIVFAWASLHHPRCRAPGWNSGPVITQTGAGVSHRSRLALLPTQRSRRAAEPDGVLPMMVVNPSLETVMLRPDRDHWRPQFDRAFADAGMAPPGGRFRVRRPIRGAAATLTPSTARITLAHPPVEAVYECELGADAADIAMFRREITGQGGILLAVSHAVDPGAGDGLARQITSAMGAGRMLCGWVALQA